MVAGSFTLVSTSAVARERLWKAGILDVAKLMPMLLPELISSVEVIEGDGGVGTITKFNFTAAVQGPTFVKTRVEVLDHANCVFKYTVIEGGYIGLRLKTYSYELKTDVGGDGGSTSTLTVEYDTLDGTDLSEEERGQVAERMMRMMKAVEGYLLANPDAYT